MAGLSTFVVGHFSDQLSRPASGTRMYRRSVINPIGATDAARAKISHIISERRGPCSGQNAANNHPPAPTRILPTRNGRYASEPYDASCPLGAIAAAYS